MRFEALGRAALFGVLTLSSGVGLGCAEAVDSAPVLAFATPECEGLGPACINAGAADLEEQGIRIIHKRIAGHPLVALHVAFDNVPRSDAQLWSENLGLALLQYGGPNRFSTSDWDAAQRRLGATVWAGSGSDYAYVDALAPLPNWRATWDLMAEAVNQPRDAASDLDNRRGVVQRGYQSEFDDPDDAAWNDAWSRLFQGHPYNQRRERLAAITALSGADIVRGWPFLTAKSRLLVTVVGDIEAAEVAEAVGTAFGVLSPEAVFEAPVAAQPAAAQPVVILPYLNAPTWHIVSYFKGPPGGSPDYAALRLGLGVLNRRLFAEVRDARGLAYTTGAELDFYRESFGAVWLTSDTPLEALPIVRQILVELLSAGPDESELDAARNNVRTSLVAGSDDPASLAWTLADWQLTAGYRGALDEYMSTLDAVTPEAARAALEAHLRGVQTTAAGGGAPLTEADLAALFPEP
jgi:zinc protease